MFKIKIIEKEKPRISIDQLKCGFPESKIEWHWGKHKDDKYHAHFVEGNSEPTSYTFIQIVNRINENYWWVYNENEERLDPLKHVFVP